MSYVSKVANSMLSHSDRASILGPEIYTVIAEWEKKEIPLPVVMDSIDELCAAQHKTSCQLYSVDNVQAVVTKNFRNWLEHQH